MRLEIEPVEFEKAAIYKVIGLSHMYRINPEAHFPMLLDSIIEEARAQQDVDVDTPTL